LLATATFTVGAHTAVVLQADDDSAAR